MDFTVFDTKKLDEYAAEAKATWGQTAAYREFQEKAKNRTNTEMQGLSAQMMALFAEFGAMRTLPPASETVQTQVKKLQAFITANFYTCSDEMLQSLGQMYAGGGRFTENIDKAGGSGTAEFTRRAIDAFCKKSEA